LLNRKLKEQNISLNRLLKRRNQRLLLLKLKQDQLNWLDFNVKTEVILNLEELKLQKK